MITRILDPIASKRMVGITLDRVEEALNSPLGKDRLLAPER